MPDFTDLLDRHDAPEVGPVFTPKPPLSLQFRHVTVGGVSAEDDNIFFPWNWTQLDHPALNNRPNAIATVTPVGRLEINDENRTVRLKQNPHPVGLVYRTRDSRWYIYNLGSEAMELNAEFNVAVHEDKRPK